MRNVILDVVLDCTFGIIGVDAAQCVVIGVIWRHHPHVTISPHDKGVNIATSRTVAFLGGCDDSEPGGLVVAMTGDHVNVVWDIALGKALLPVVPPLGGDVAWVIDLISLHCLEKVVDRWVVIVVIDIVGSRVAIGVDGNDGDILVGDPRPGIPTIGVLSDVSGVCRVGEIHE